MQRKAGCDSWMSPAGGCGFFQLCGFAPDAGHHQRLAVAPQGVFQHMGELGGSVGDVIPTPHRQGDNDLQAQPNYT